MITNLQNQMTITELIKDLEIIKIRDGDLWDKTTIKNIHNVAIEKDKFQIFNIPINYI